MVSVQIAGSAVAGERRVYESDYLLPAWVEATRELGAGFWLLAAGQWLAGRAEGAC
jgi:hypothetical protein